MLRPARGILFLLDGSTCWKNVARVDAGISIQLLSEHGVGKSALARRIHSETFYTPHVTPAKDVLTAILKKCYRRGWHDVESKDGEEMNEATLERTLRKMDVKAATAAAVQALRERRAIQLIRHPGFAYIQKNWHKILLLNTLGLEEIAREKGIGVLGLNRHDALFLEISLSSPAEQKKIMVDVQALEKQIAAAESRLAQVVEQKAAVLRKYL